jgi:Tfp pilus assembly protein PilN
LRVSSLSFIRYSCLLKRAYAVSTFMSELLVLPGTSVRLNSSTRIDSCRMRAYSYSISELQRSTSLLLAFSCRLRSTRLFSAFLLSASASPS